MYEMDCASAGLFIHYVVVLSDNVLINKREWSYNFILFADVLILPEEVEWIKFNVGMNGYYIVHYEDDGWDALISLLKENHTAISSNDRASLINNVFQLVR